MQKVIGNGIGHDEDDVGAATLLGGSVEKKVHSSIDVFDFWDFFLDSSRCVRFLKSVWSTWE
jgi:hypothetical protein